MIAPGTRWSRVGLRGRLLLIGVLGVATALAIGSVTLYAVLTLLSYRTLDAAARATALDVAGLVEQGRLPDVIPVAGSGLVQVVDDRDRVVSASSGSDRLTALLRPDELRAAARGDRLVVDGSRVGLASPLRVLAVRAGPADARRTVVVAERFDDIEHTQRLLRLTLLVADPLLLLALALLAWRTMGATLQPVESMRASAERISGNDEVERLPLPPAADEIRRLAETLNKMLDRLAAGRARQRGFVADAAHELRSPLASMQAQLDVAERVGDPLPGAGDLRAEVDRMSALVEDLLELARIDSGLHPTLDPEPLAVGPLLEAVFANRPAGRVTVTARPTSLTVLARADDVRRALANLVDNAVRHAETRVVLSATREDAGSVVLVVEDDGAGIPVADRERVLERFTRLDAGRDRDAGGSGLGLAIAHELARRNGGGLRLSDAESGGLLVELVLPSVVDER